MRFQTRVSAYAISLAALAFSSACGSTGTSPLGAHPDAVTVQIAPATAQVAPRALLSFTASVSGSVDTSVTWEVVEPSGGSVDASGHYTAPASTGTFHVRVSSRADATKSDVATVTVQPGTPCQPLTCRSGIDCGSFPDGCGATLSCGNTCATGQTCGGGGTPNACGGGGGTHLFLNGFFPIAAYGQVPQDFQAWKDMGVNTVQGVPSQSVAEWASAARALGLKRIRQPIGSTGASPPSAGDYRTVASDPDRGTGNVISWEGVMPNSSGWDEIETSIGPGANTVGYATNTANALRSLDPSVPVFLNSGINGLSSTANGWPFTGGSFNYQGLFQGIDWVCNDIYPYGGSSYNDDELRGSMGGDHVVTAQDLVTFPELSPILGKGAVASIGAITDKLRALLPSKTFFSFIEIACVTSASPTVPPGGVRAEIWDAIIHGARGIFIFAFVGQTRPGFSDGGCGPVPAANAAELKRQAALITSLGNVIQDAINPPSLGATLSHPALEAGWRDTPTGKYFFVLNTTNAALPAPATIQLSGVGNATSAIVHGESRSVSLSSGSFTDTFGAYALHIYMVP